jgi:hypothetical protein
MARNSDTSAAFDSPICNTGASWLGRSFLVPAVPRTVIRAAWWREVWRLVALRCSWPMS